MNLSWAFWLSVLLSGEEVYVYVEDTPDQHSQMVLEALQTPVETLYARNPCQTTSDYLDDLWDARCQLAGIAAVTIRTRDMNNLPPDLILPGIAFSPREYPIPLNPQCYHHWTLVVDHLKYLCLIRQYVTQHEVSTTSRYVFDVKAKMTHSWMLSDTIEEKGDTTWNGFPAQYIKRITRFRFRFEPCPPISLPLPYKITYSLDWTGDTSRGNHQSLDLHYCTPEHIQALLTAADMNTGFVLSPEEPTENPDDR